MCALSHSRQPCLSAARKLPVAAATATQRRSRRPRAVRVVRKRACERAVCVQACLCAGVRAVRLSLPLVCTGSGMYLRSCACASGSRHGAAGSAGALASHPDGSCGRRAQRLEGVWLGGGWGAERVLRVLGVATQAV